MIIKLHSLAGPAALRAEPVLRGGDLRAEGRRQLHRLTRLGVPLRQEQVRNQIRLDL